MQAYRIAFDGRDFHGYQRQPNVRTVEGVLFEALEELSVLEPRADRPPGYAAAGRTDAGVSALAQTIGLEAPDWLTPRALNGSLPGSVRAWASAAAPPDFHATHWARERTYTYHLWAPDGDPESAVDDDRVRTALDRLSGDLQVRNLARDQEPETRTVTADADRDGPILRVSVTASGFPREFVRRLVTLVRDVGRGAVPLELVDRVQQPTPLPGEDGIGPAPPEPLVLTDVTYPSLSFERDEEAARSAERVFAEREGRHAAATRVAAQLKDGVSR